MHCFKSVVVSYFHICCFLSTNVVKEHKPCDIKSTADRHSITSVHFHAYGVSYACEHPHQLLCLVLTTQDSRDIWSINTPAFFNLTNEHYMCSVFCSSWWSSGLFSAATHTHQIISVSIFDSARFNGPARSDTFRSNKSKDCKAVCEQY